MQASSKEAEALDFVESLYGERPDWCRVSYSDEGLSFLEAGCTWIEEGKPPSIQLKKSFQYQDTLFGIYDAGEILVHEYTHAIRSAIASSRFEEMFAYYASYRYLIKKSRYFRPIALMRLVLGPLFSKKSTQAGLLMLIIGSLLYSLAQGADLSISPIAPAGLLACGALILMLQIVHQSFLWLIFLTVRRNYQKLFLCKGLPDASLSCMIKHSDSELVDLYKGKKPFLLG